MLLFCGAYGVMWKAARFAFKIWYRWWSPSIFGKVALSAFSLCFACGHRASIFFIFNTKMFGTMIKLLFCFSSLNLRSVLQDSEIVIENISAKYGAGFHVKGNVYISVGHSVHPLPYWGWKQSQPWRLTFTPRDFSPWHVVKRQCVFRRRRSLCHS